MILIAKYFDGRFEKIAQAITKITDSGYSKSSISSGSNNQGSSGSGFKRLGDPDINSTISKVRKNADIQPLHKDDSRLETPRDAATTTQMTKKQDYLSNIEDRRLTHHHLRLK